MKGANLEMERIESSLRGWPQAPFRTKLEVDANYKRMLHEAMRPENLAAVRVAVGSHNLFELAYGLVLARASGALGRVQFEMLEGMANHQRRALFELTKNLLLYAAATRKPGLHLRYRLSDPPARREHRSGQLPASTPSSSGWGATSGRRSRPSSFARPPSPWR